MKCVMFIFHVIIILFLCSNAFFILQTMSIFILTVVFQTVQSNSEFKNKKTMEEHRENALHGLSIWQRELFVTIKDGIEKFMRP